MMMDMGLDMKLSRNCAMLDYESYRTIRLGLLLCIPVEFKHPSNIKFDDYGEICLNL